MILPLFPISKSRWCWIHWCGKNSIPIYIHASWFCTYNYFIRSHVNVHERRTYILYEHCNGIPNFRLIFFNDLFQVVFAVLFAAAQAAVVAPYGLPYAYAGHPIAHAGYAAPVAAYAAPAPVAAPIPAPVSYALPPAREIETAPVVEQSVEPVEQWGYSVRY